MKVRQRDGLLVRRWLPIFEAAFVASSVCGSAAAASPAAMGQRVFDGPVALHGRLYTQADDLPTKIVRCANCHSFGTSPPVPNSNAPRLSSQWLEQLRQRRGGPKSSYDATRFCSLLRTGVDPVHIVINVEMPRYQMTDEECRALWAFLTRTSNGK
jgi:hypothetical protein